MVLLVNHDEIFAKMLSDPDSGGLSVMYPTGIRSPATDYREMTIGSARIIRIKQPPGRYPIADFHTPLITVQETVPVTHLQTREPGEEWRTWMTDEPAHWLMLHEIARRIKGPSVCMAGLGLGLILHVLAERTDITHVMVIERSQDVCDLITPNVPQSRTYRLHVHSTDFWTFVKMNEPGTFDTFFIDLWRGSVTEQVYDVLAKAEIMTFCHPGSVSLFFCFQNAVDRHRMLSGA